MNSDFTSCLGLSAHDKFDHMKPAELAQKFEDLFGSRPRIFCAPGRVNLLGEHTDYNDGFVMPCAIGFSTRVAISPRPDHRLVIRSEDFPEQLEIDIDHLPSQGTGVWSDYVLGIAVMLKEAGHPISGASLLVRGEVPIGAGLSSSAAIEVASALALMSLNGTRLALPEVAKLCQRAENEFIGARVGIMDQFVSCLGRAGHALLLDCRSLEFKLIPIPDDIRLVICNTMVKHEHSSGAYNRRREECDEGVKILRQWYPKATALRDISLEQLQQHKAAIPETVYKRCLHVVSENKRVLEGGKYLTDGDVRTVWRIDAGLAPQSARPVRSKLQGTGCHGGNGGVPGRLLRWTYDRRWIRRLHRESGEGSCCVPICRSDCGAISGGNWNQTRHLRLRSRKWRRRGLRRASRKAAERNFAY